MSKFIVGNLVYIPPIVYNLIYDKNKPSYPIKEIQTTEEYVQQGYGSGNYAPETKYNFIVNINGEDKSFNHVKLLPNLQVNGINISEFKINDKTIDKIEIDEGNWNFVHGKGYIPEYPNRLKYTLSDNSIVYSDEYKITEVVSGGRSRTKKNKKYKKSRKLRRKSNRHR